MNVKRSKKIGFTLIELLAVLVILSILLVIAVPQVLNVISNAKKGAFESDAKLVVKALEDEESYSDTFNPTSINISNIKNELGLSDDNYNNLDVSTLDGRVDVAIVGKNKWNGLTACGTYNNMTVSAGDSCSSYPSTDESCFTFDSNTKTIKHYNFSDSSCPTDNIVIPSKISDVDVENIAPGAFADVSGQICYNDEEEIENDVGLDYVHTDGDGYDDCYFYSEEDNPIVITGIKLPDHLKTIGYDAFIYNQLTNVTIPNGVTGIGEGAFSDNQLTSVTIPNSITSIGKGAFSDNQLTSITIPTSLTTINAYAFQGNQLTDIMIPNNVTSIGEGAFSDNQLESVTIPNGVTGIGDNAFSDNQLTSITIPTNLTTINAYTFAYNQLADINIPNNVTSIGEGAFSDNQLSDITIPSSITSIGNDAFYNNLLGTITIEGNDPHRFDDTWRDIGFPLMGDECFTFDSSTGTITGYDWSCSKHAVIPSTIGGVTVRIIGTNAFINKSLISVTIPNGVTTIGESAFSSNKLTNLTIPSSVTSIGYRAFEDNKISSLTIPSSVTSVGGDAFNDNQLPDNQAFIYVRNSDGTEDKTGIISYGGAKRSNVIIPSGVTDIGSFAFEEDDITSVTIPSSITILREGVFYDNKLTSITIPSNITSIGYYAFYNNELQSLTIPSSVTSIGEAAFNINQLPDNQAFIYARNSDGTEDRTEIVSYGGAKKDNVVIPSNVTSIYNSSFENTGITSITIPSGVTSIGIYAFYWNPLTSVTIQGANPQRFNSNWANIGFPTDLMP